MGMKLVKLTECTHLQLGEQNMMTPTITEAIIITTTTTTTTLKKFAMLTSLLSSDKVLNPYHGEK